MGEAGACSEDSIWLQYIAKYRSVERMSARNLILSDSAPKNKLIYQNTMVFGLHQKLHIPEYGR